MDNCQDDSNLLRESLIAHEPVAFWAFSHILWSYLSFVFNLNSTETNV